jgi:hypothetical protein
VIYATHSPLFVGLDRIESLRLLTLEDGGAAPVTVIHRVDLAAIAAKLWDATGQPGEPFTAATLHPRLRLLGQSPVSEGFFASGVVLVEGDEDVALIRAAGRARGWEFDDLGIAIVPVSGKNNLDRPLLVFQALGIPTYLVFDGDKSKGEESASANCLLLNLLHAEVVDHPQTQICGDWACFEEKIGNTVRSEIGHDAWDEALLRICRDLGYSDGGTKNSMVMEEVHRRLAEQGLESPSLAGVLDAIGGRFGL